MPEESINLIYLIEHSLKKELKYIKVLQEPPCRMAALSD